MIQRSGIGRVRHLDAAMLWIQQSEKERVLQATPIPSETNPSDIGTKVLSKARAAGLLYLMKMVNILGRRIGREEWIRRDPGEEGDKRAERSLEDCCSDRIGRLDTSQRRRWKRRWARYETLAGHFILVLAFVGALSLVGAAKEGFKKPVNVMFNACENKCAEEAVSLQEEKATQATDMSNNVDLWEYDKQLKEAQEEELRLEAEIEDLREKLAASEAEAKMRREIDEGQVIAENKLRDAMRIQNGS